MHLLKQSTAATVIVGPVLDSSGAAVTTAVVGDFRLAKEGSSAVLSGATVTHDANGYYLIALTTTNTNTVGRLAIYSNNTAQSMGTTRFMVLLPSVYDALVTNATNTTGGLPAATGAITALAGAVSTLTASGVRTELATELARIDATISSRLATASYTAPLDATSTAAAVWNAALATYTTAGTFGARVVRSTNSNAELFLNGSGHGAAVLHNCDPNSIPETAFVTGALSARALAADAAAEVATATRTELATELARIDATVSSRSTLTAGGVRTELATELARIDATVSSRAAASDLTTLLNRIGAFTGTGVNTVLGFLKALASKAASTPSDIGGTFSATTDSTEAIRDAMQAGTGDASQATLVQVQGTVDAIAASISGTAINVVSRVADGGSITLYAGDDMRVRSGTEVAVTISDVGGAIYTRLNSIGVAYLSFGAARPTQPAGAITGTIASLAQAGSGSSQTLTINIEIEDGGERLAPADNYVWQIVSSDAQGAEYDTYTEIEGTLTLKRRVAVPVYS